MTSLLFDWRGRKYSPLTRKWKIRFYLTLLIVLFVSLFFFVFYYMFILICFILYYSMYYHHYITFCFEHINPQPRFDGSLSFLLYMDWIFLKSCYQFIKEQCSEYSIPFTESLIIFFSITFFIILLIYSNKKLKNNKYFSSYFVLISSFKYIYLFIILLFFLNVNFILNNNSDNLLYGHYFLNYNYLLIFKGFILILFLFFFFFLHEYIKLSKFSSFELIVLFLFILFALLTLLVVNNFLVLYLLLEIYSLSIYSVIGLHRHSNKSVEASIKYFIYGSFSSVILLFSFSLLYGLTSFTYFSDLSLFFWNNDTLFNEFDIFSILLLFSMILFILSFLFKMGIAPFHFWAVEVYNGSPLIITFFLVLIPKLIFILLLLRLYFDVFNEFHEILSTCFYPFIIVTAIIGVFGAVFQIKLKKIFIYSSIFNSSFFLIPFVANSPDILSAWFFYLFIYAFNTMNIFLLLFTLFNSSTKKHYNSLSSLVNMFYHNKILGIYFSTSILSLAGLPPFSGFFGKFLLFFSLIDSNYIFLFFFLNIMNLIGLFYYLRLVRLIFINNKKYPPLFLKTPSRLVSIILSFFFLLNISFIFFADLLLNFSNNIAIQFFLSS